jgi:serine/threonine protein kinase
MSRPNWIGKILVGRYRIDEILGQGGMSAVYKAYDPNLKRVVAVKMIHSHLADDPKFVARFEEEAAAVAQLRHPNIVQVFDFNHDEDLYFMVQEFVAGETLQERLRRLNRAGRRMSMAEAVQITRNICDAAGYAHQRGMVHRDIKPANIMLDVNGQAILMDFGIVKIVGSDRHTATGAVVGTALYLPPEMVRGLTPDARSDMYSLGVTLFEMVNGHPPFEADSAMTLMLMHLNDPLPDMRQLRPEVPDELIAVIERSLAKEREQRYPSMAAMAAALQSALGGAGAAVATATVIDQPPAAQATEMTPPPVVPAVVAASLAASDNAVGAIPVSSDQAIPTQPSLLRSPNRARASHIAQMDQTIPQQMPVEASCRCPAHGGPCRLAMGGDLPPTGAASPGWATPSGGAAPPGGALPPTGATSAVQPSGKKLPLAVWIGGGAALLVILLVSIYLLTGGFGGGTQTPSVGELPSSTAPAGAALPATETPSPSPTLAPTITPTSLPTETPTPTVSPTPTIPVGLPYVRINGITLDNQARYIVDYETFVYTEVLPGQHVHFFFNTVPPEQAGNPGKGPWYLWGGPRPFDKFKQSDRPAAATMMCSLVANPDHSVQLNSGTCTLLPDIVAVAPVSDTTCVPGADQQPAAAVPVAAGQIVLVHGISADESWWNVTNPQDTNQTCWLPRQITTVHGDIGQLPLVESPPLTTGAAAGGMFVEITGITIDEQNRYVVQFSPQGYTPALPGTHIHFFFDNVPPDQVGMTGGGNRLMFGGPAPFTGYATTDRPAEAGQLCALVANNDHSVIADSGNCFASLMSRAVTYCFQKTEVWGMSRRLCRLHTIQILFFTHLEAGARGGIATLLIPCTVIRVKGEITVGRGIICSNTPLPPHKARILRSRSFYGTNEWSINFDPGRRAGAGL